MPRKSAAAYLIPAPVDGRPTRLRPPADIPPSVAGVMAEIIGSVDAAHLRACDLAMVEELARTIVTQRATAHALIGAPLVVSGKPNPLLVMERAGEPMKRDHLMTRILNLQMFTDDRYIYLLFAQLRKKLGDRAANAKIIATNHFTANQLTPEVTRT